jgi:hypothetical protein
MDNIARKKVRTNVHLDLAPARVAGSRVTTRMSTARVTSSLTKFGGVRRTDCTEHVQATSVTRSLLVRRETHHLLNDPDSSGLLSDIGHELSCSTSSSSPSISECIYEARTSDRVLPQVGYLICCALAAPALDNACSYCTIQQASALDHSSHKYGGASISFASIGSVTFHTTLFDM